MKTRNKLILSAAAMLTISAAAMITGTVAWFTTVRQATITFTDVTVVSTVGNLKVSYVGSEDDVTFGDGGDFTINQSATSTDVSGDGLTLYKPLWNVEGVSALRIDDVSSTGFGLGYFAEFQLLIERDNAAVDNGFLVYLGSTSALVPADAGEDADNAAVNSARVAFLNAGASDRMLTWAPKAGDTSYTYIDAVSGQTAYGLSGYQVLTYPTDDSFVVGAISNHTALDGSGGHTGGNSPVIADLTNDGTDPIDKVTITVRVWIEGNDEHATNDAINGVFSVKLNLYAMSL